MLAFMAKVKGLSVVGSQEEKGSTHIGGNHSVRQKIEEYTFSLSYRSTLTPFSFKYFNVLTHNSNLYYFMKKTEIKKVVRLSWIREWAAKEFEGLRCSPNLDSSFFTAEEMEHYIGVLIKSHANEWMVIDDIRDEGAF